MEITLGHSGQLRQVTTQLTSAEQGEWTTATLLLDTSTWATSPTDRQMNEVLWTIPAGACLQLDDVLLYEPTSR